MTGSDEPSHAERAEKHRELMRRKLHAAAEVLKAEHDALIRANRHATLSDRRDLHELSVDDRKLEVRLFEHGLAIQVIREAKLINVLRVVNMMVIDQQGAPVSDPERYFSEVVNDFVLRRPTRDPGLQPRW